MDKYGYSGIDIVVLIYGNSWYGGPDKYGYSGIVFDAHLQFSLLIDDWRENLIFVVNKSSSRHADNRKKRFSWFLMKG